MKTRKSQPGVVKALGAIRDSMNEELAGTAFVEQQRHLRQELEKASVSASLPQHQGRPSA